MPVENRSCVCLIAHPPIKLSGLRLTMMNNDRSPHDRSDLMVKKLRYYARFIVVCLLLKKMKLVRDLVRELSKQIGNFFFANILYTIGQFR